MKAPTPKAFHPLPSLRQRRYIPQPRVASR